MPTLPYYYVEQSEIESYLNTALTENGVNTFNLLQQSIQDMVDAYTNRTWNFTSPVTEYLNLFEDTYPPSMKDTFFLKATIDPTPFSNAYPRAGGIQSITIGETNGVGGTPLDLTYVFQYGTWIKVWTWNPMISMFNPLGFQAVKIIYNSSDAGNVPQPVKIALIQWVSRLILSSSEAGKETKEVMAGTIRAYFQEDQDILMPNFVKGVLEKYRLTPIDHQ